MAQIHQLKIKNFRGVKDFTQTFGDTNLIVLIGRGDSGKSTILEAISMVLSPAWNLKIYDTDFHNIDPSQSIEIEVSLKNVPDELLTDGKYGLYKRLLKNGEISDDILEDDSDEAQDILTIKMTVDNTLQPQWLVTNNREGQEDKEISYRDRALLNMFMIADYNDRHFSYNRISPLYTLLKQSGKNPRSIEQKIVEIVRNTYQSVSTDSNFEEFGAVTERIKKQANNLGLNVSNLQTLLEYKGNSYTESNITLHDKNTPYNLYGKGSKRLLSMAIQLELVQQGGIILIDEIEQGLEPDRIRTIIKRLNTIKQGQIFITTHSRDVLVETSYNTVYLTRKAKSSLHTFDEGLQGLLRLHPEAFFSKRIILCEGATEYGFIRAIDSYLIKKTNRGLSLRSISAIDCKGGDKFYRYAIQLKQNGYDVITFNDDDNSSISKSKKEALDNSVTMAICETGKSVEEQIFSDVPWETVIQLVELAIELKSQNIISSILKDSSISDINDIEEQENIRALLGKKASEENWYKNVTYGEKFGEKVMESYGKETQGTERCKLIELLIKWIDESTTN